MPSSLSCALAFLPRLLPQLGRVSRTEQIRASVGALCGIVVTGIATRLILGADAAVPLLVAPMGASAVLLFAVPSGPLSQPWSILGGNLVSALIGISCRMWIADPLIAASVAVCLSIVAMFLLRCLHPPGGAVAVTTVLAGPPVDAFGYAFAVVPVGLNSLLLLLMAVAFNNLTGHRYPHLRPGRAERPAGAGASTGTRLNFTLDDLRTALRAQDEVVDVDPNDLVTILHAAEEQAFRRRASGLLCKHVMSRRLVTVSASESIANAWDIMQSRKLRFLPVTDEDGVLLGMLRAEDFVGAVGRGAGRPAFGSVNRLRKGLAAGFSVRDRVQRIMANPGCSATAETPVSELIPRMAAAGLHQAPVIDGSRRLVGVVTQTDLVDALFRGNAEVVGSATAA